MALQRQTLSIPIAGGIDTKTDEKQVPIGKALALENVRFQKTGKLSKRFGSVKKSVTTTANNLDTYSLNAVISDNEYLAVKTQSGIFGFSSSSDKWTKQNSYSGGAKIKTEFVAKNYYDQTFVSQDTSSDGKYTAFCCFENKGASTYAYLLVLQDNETGIKKYAVVTAPIMSGNPRVICEYDSGVLKVSFYFYEGSLIPSYSRLARIIYDVDLVILVAKTTITNMGGSDGWNVIKNGSSQYVLSLFGTTLNCKSFSFGGVAQVSTAITVPSVCSYAILAAKIVGTNIHIAYPKTGAFVIIGISTSTLLTTLAAKTEITTGIDPYRITFCYTGTTLYLILDTAAGDSVTLNGYEVVAYSIPFTTVYGFFVQQNKAGRIQLSSDAYYVDGKIQCVVTSTSTNSNDSYYIYDPVNNVMAQVFSPTLAYTGNGATSSVSVIGNQVYMALARKKGIATNPGEAFSTVGLASTTLRYGCNYKDNSRVKVDQRLYVNDGSLIELDKNLPHENGFVMKAEFQQIATIAGVANPNVASKTFSYALIYEYYDSNGLITRSAPAYFTSLGLTPVNTASIEVKFLNPVGSLKYAGVFTKPMSAVIYRTENLGSVYYRVGEVVLANNGYSNVTFSDTVADATITDNEVIYTTGDILENNPAPPAEFCFSGGNRIFLGGLEEADEIAFSKKQLFGESVAFNDLFRIRVATGSSSDKTPIGAGAYMDGKVIIFRGQSIYFCQGDGPNEVGFGNFSDPEIISSDVGCNEPRSVLSTPMGVMFKSKKGIYLLDRALSVSYIGAPVEDFNSNYVVASCLSEKYNEARFYLDSGDCLVFNYLFQTWSVFKNQTTIDADNWRGMPVVIKSNAVYHEAENYYLDGSATAFYSMKFVSPWLKLDLVQGYARAYQLWIIGAFKSAHTLKCRIYTDYDSSTYEDYSLVYSSADSPQYQFQISLPKQKVESIKFEIYDDLHAAASNGEAYDLSNIQVEVGLKAGGYKLAASKSY